MIRSGGGCGSSRATIPPPTHLFQIYLHAKHAAIGALHSNWKAATHVLQGKGSEGGRWGQAVRAGGEGRQWEHALGVGKRATRQGRQQAQSPSWR